MVKNLIGKIKELVGDYFKVDESSTSLVFRRYIHVYVIDSNVGVNGLKGDLDRLIILFDKRDFDNNYLIMLRDLLKPLIDRKAKIKKILKEIVLK